MEYLRLFVLCSLLVACSDTSSSNDDATDRMGKHFLLVNNTHFLFGNEIAKKYDLELLVRGTGELIDSKEAQYSHSFMSYKPMALTECRQLVKQLLEEEWAYIKNHRDYKDYLDSMNDFYIVPTDYHIHPHIFGLMISFWDEDLNRKGEPFISHVRISDGKIYYYYRKKDSQHLQMPIIETYEEARVILDEKPVPT